MTDRNMNVEIFNLMRKYCGIMASQGYTLGSEAKIYVKAKGKCYTTKSSAELINLQNEDILILQEKEINLDLKAEILMKLKNVNALVVSNTSFCRRSSREGKEICAVLDDMAQIIGTKAPLVNYNKNEMRKALNKSAACIVKDKYTISTGRNLYEAIVAMMVLEKSAEVYLKAQVLGGGKKINELEAGLMRYIYKRKYSKGEEKVKSSEAEHLKEDILPYLNNEENVKADLLDNISEESNEIVREALIREALVEYGRKLLQANLVQGTWGNISIRLNEEYMLVTPSGRDYNTLTSQDMVKVNINTLNYEGNLKPTSEKDLHGSIYAARKDLGAVIHTHSKYCCIFAAAGQPIPVEDLKLKSIFGEEVAIAGYGLPGTRKLTKNILEAVGKNYAAIMANHGMICCGVDIKGAFENCLELEQYGASYIEARYK